MVQASVRWDPDGPGPSPELVVVGGRFTKVGSLVANRIAAWNPVTGQWSAFGSGIDGGPNTIVNALAVMPNGDLVAAGHFASASGVNALAIARWNGSAWAPMGTGLAIGVSTLLVLPNGDLLAGGSFVTAGLSAIARWDGSTWNPLGTGIGSFANPLVRSLALLPNGDVVAGGSFNTAGGAAAENVARWNGVAWSALGAGANNHVLALATMPSGDLVAGGYFTYAGGIPASHLARWNGATWSAFGAGLAHPQQALVQALLPQPNGDLIVGGIFSNAGGVPANSVALWSAGSWSAIGAGLSLAPPWTTSTSSGNANTLLQLAGGEVLVGGWFTSAGGIAASHLAQLTGGAWSSLSNGTDGQVMAMLRLPSGELLAGGQFTSINGVQAKRIAKWDGVTWSPLGGGIDVGLASTGVHALAMLPNGDIVAGGGFTAAGGVPASNVALWNGATWSPMAAGVGGPVYSLVTLPNGDVVAGGQFALAGGLTVNSITRWNGSTWGAVGVGVGGTSFLGVFIPGKVLAMVAEPNGNIVAGGDFPTAGGNPIPRLARWDGIAWTTIGAPPFAGFVNALTWAANGDLLAAHNQVSRWNGITWTTLPSTTTWGVMRAVLELPDGDIVAGVVEYPPWPAATVSHVDRWDGASWSTVGSGLVGELGSVALLANGEIAVGGGHLVVGGQVSGPWSRLATSCPATSAVSGGGCAGSAGPVTLAPATLPWIGSTFTAVAAGMPSNALALGVYGLNSIVVPLPTILPQGVAGCMLLASPDWWSLHLATAGSVTTALPLPDSLSLVGATFVHQVVVFELATTGDITAVTSSSGYGQVIGAL